MSHETTLDEARRRAMFWAEHVGHGHYVHRDVSIGDLLIDVCECGAGFTAGKTSAPPPTPDVERLTWQPIATCPVGERVLIGGGGCPRVHENELRDFRSAGRAFAGLGDAEQPTHWMPLPDRPVAGDTPTPGGEQPR